MSDYDSSKRFQTFAEFWPFYLSQHSHPMNRLLHIVGTCLSLILLPIFFFVKPVLLILVPIVGYSFAWFGHFMIEKNKPATFKYFRFSLMGDFKMTYLALTGNLKSKNKPNH